MNKKYRFMTRFLMCFTLVVTTLVVVSCKDNDELDTNQLDSSKITLNAFGPSPALRGGELRFVGTNMHKVTGVVVPGVNEEITEFTKKEKNEIRIILPRTAEPGFVVIHTPEGDITTKTQLAIEEPIIISAITTAKVKAGATFAIEGEYLNLISKVVFTENAAIEAEDFVSHSYEKIEVIVPNTARSGEIMLSNGAEIPIEVYSGELQADIVAPVITKIEPASVKPGDELTLTGTDFDLVQYVVFSQGLTAETFVMAEDGKSITVTVPVGAQDGPVTVVAFSSAEAASSNLTLKMPTANIADKLLKNNATITITGTDLDLVTGVWFDDVEAGFEATAEQITLTVPATASSNFVNLATASTKEFKIEGLTYVTPAITTITPMSITAGDEITITGTDLDLVTSIAFVSADGTIVLPVANDNESSFTVKSPYLAVSGTVTLTTDNGTKVVVPEFTIDEAELPGIITMPEMVKPLTMFTITGVNFETVTAVEFIYEDGTELAATRYLPNEDGTSMSLYTPDKVGNAVIRLYQGTRYNDSDVQFFVGNQITLWEGEVGPIDWSGSHKIPLDVSLLVPGQTFRIEFECPASAEYWQMEIMGAWWGGLPTPVELNETQPGRAIISFQETDTYYQFPLAQGDIDVLTTQESTILFCGNGVVVKALRVILPN